MIDTIKLSYPLCAELKELLLSRAHMVSECSPDGEVLWEKSVIKGNVMPSHYSGLRITIREKDDYTRKCHFEPKAFFEFSLQKYRSKSAYNNKNTELESDLVFLRSWIKTLSKTLDFYFEEDNFRLNRVDLSQNLEVQDGFPLEVLRSLELRMSKHKDAQDNWERKKTGLFYRSSYIGMKLYSKYHEFYDVERKKRKDFYSNAYLAGELIQLPYVKGFVPLTKNEIDDLKKIIRFECEFKGHYLREKEIMKIHQIKDLKKAFDEKKSKLYTIQKIRSKAVEMTPTEERLVRRICEIGYKGARAEYLLEQGNRQAFWKHQRKLSLKGIDLNCIKNPERVMADEFENLQNFTLKVA